MAQNLVHKVCDDAISRTLPFVQRGPLTMSLDPEPQVDSAAEEYSTDEACSKFTPKYTSRQLAKALQGVERC